MARKAASRGSSRARSAQQSTVDEKVVALGTEVNNRIDAEP
ncbi:hypothetical protein [Allokutzneria albata]|nr:hypothetical protein [Allokutzneria albata]